MISLKALHFHLLLLLTIFVTASPQYIPSTHNNFCLGGKQIRNINTKQRAFNAGPCSPIILVPGFVATALQVEIDCNLLRENHAEIFGECGWSTCNASDLLSSIRMPKKEYRLWVGDLTDKFSILQSREQKCLGDFLKVQDWQKGQAEQLKGVNVTWAGNTLGSKDFSCGASAVQNLAGGRISFIKNCALNGFQKHISMLQNMGYISGVNYQVIPYDFRKDVFSSEASSYIQNSINNLFKATGKKVVLFGHSYGNLHILKVLQGMTLAEKKEKVNNFVSVGAPFQGSAKIIKELVGGDSQYIRSVLSFELGFNYFSQKSLTMSSRSLFHFLPRHSGQTLPSCPSWLPPSDSNFPLGDLLTTPNKPLLYVGNTSYDSQKQDYFRLFNSFDSQRKLKFQQILQQEFNHSNSLFTLQKPDVNTTLIFSSSVPTDIQYTYDSLDLEKDQFRDPVETVMGGGDGTVSSMSNVVTAVKWIQEKNHGGVKLINYGGQNQQNYLHNEYYNTMPFSCSNRPNDQCLHPCFHQDPNVLNYLFQTLLSYKRVGLGRLVHPDCKNLKIKNNHLVLPC